MIIKGTSLAMIRMRIWLFLYVIAKERSDCGNLLLTANILLKFGLVNCWIVHANIRGWSKPCPLTGVVILLDEVILSEVKNLKIGFSG